MTLWQYIWLLSVIAVRIPLLWSFMQLSMLDCSCTHAHWEKWWRMFSVVLGNENAASTTQGEVIHPKYTDVQVWHYDSIFGCWVWLRSGYRCMLMQLSMLDCSCTRAHLEKWWRMFCGNYWEWRHSCLNMSLLDIVSCQSVVVQQLLVVSQAVHLLSTPAKVNVFVVLGNKNAASTTQGEITHSKYTDVQLWHFDNWLYVVWLRPGYRCMFWSFM